MIQLQFIELGRYEEHMRWLYDEWWRRLARVEIFSLHAEPPQAGRKPCWLPLVMPR